MSDKRVLIITYYWPPSGGSGVQRWLKFVKYLPSFGWQPFVFTPENPSFEIKDESLVSDIPQEAEVIKLPIWEPYKIFNSLSSVFQKNKSAGNVADSSAQPGFFVRITNWIRGNLFIPDPRIFWVRPAVNFLDDFIRDRKITTIITTGPPHSMHLIGLRLKKKNSSLHWIADFRDPWTEWGLWEKLGLGKWALRRHRKLEQRVLTNADLIVSVTPFYVQRFSVLSGKKAVLLTNGYDEDDFKDIVYTKSKKFTVRHIGIVNEQRDPIPFMEALLQLINESEEFRQNLQVEFVGEVYQLFKDYVRSKSEFNDIVILTGNVSHEAVMRIYGETSVLLLILTGYKDPHGFFPGKVFEYVATGIPLLGIGPTVSDAASLIDEAGTGAMINPDDITGIKTSLTKLFLEWKSTDQPVVKKPNVVRYSRKAITEQLVNYLK